MKAKVKEWFEYQKTTNVFIDSFLETAPSLNYYFFSLGPVALGISTYRILSDDEMGLFKRFLNVFEMAYRRFLDIEKAEFQAREAQIELALERVRARTMAMLHSNELAETVAVMFEQFKALGEEPERMAIEIVNEKEHVFDIWATQHGGSQLSESAQISLDEPHVMKKMYKAWAQAREAQIEAALERVRSRSMGMQKSEELKEVIKIVYQQLILLKINLDHAGFVVDYKPKGDWTFWIADERDIPTQITHPWFESVWANQFNEAKENGEDLFATNLNFEEKNKFYNELLSHVSGLPEASRDFYLSCPGLAATTVLLENVALYIENFSGTSYTAEENNILIRFARVFEQTYTRFLDLQKAEAQAREAQIEGALERVRSTSLAMYSSMDLSKVVFVVFTELMKLDARLDRCLLLIVDPKKLDITWYLTGKEGLLSNNGFLVPDNTHPSHQAYLEGWRTKRKKWQYLLGGDEKRRWDAYGFSQTGLAQLPDFIKADMSAVETIHLTISSDNFGCLIASSLSPLSEVHAAIVDRFTSVFNQAYTRFLDLQRAEAQSREAKIEAALERVRSRTMAMRGSEELLDVASILFQQVKALGVPQWNCGFNIWEIGDEAFTYYPGTPDGIISQAPCKIPLTEHPVFQRFDESRKRGDELLIYEKQGEEQVGHYQYMLSLPGVGDLLNSMLDAGFEFPVFQIDHVANFAYGNLIFITYEHFPEMHDVFKRFAKVFEQTYTRFLDLQKAEAQAIEATKRASVDRVRAEIASMRTTKDLERITPLIWNELTTLGVPFIRSGVFIMDEAHKQVQVHLSTPDGKAIAAFQLNYEASVQSRQIVSHWREMKVFKDHMDEAAFAEYTKNLVQQGALAGDEKYVTENHPTDLYLHFLPFAQGMLYVGNDAPLKEEELQLVQDLADAFSTAYARYEDFNKLEAAKLQVDKALVNLKQAQQQLVQSEKMASWENSPQVLPMKFKTR